MKDRLMRRLAKPMLFAAALIWGSSFFIMKDTLDVVPVASLLAIRFTAAALLLAVLFASRWKKLTPDYLWRGAVIGAFLFAAYYVQTQGLARTTPSKNAFLTAIYCVLVPFLHWLTAGRRPDRWNVLAALLCVTGVGLVSLSGEGLTELNAGDLLTLCAACLFAAHIVAVDRLAPGKDVFLLTVFQFAFAALYAWIGSLWRETMPWDRLAEPRLWLPLAYLCVMATTAALLFQNVGQIWSDPASASLILSLESVFGVVCSVIFYGDEFTFAMLCGFACIFAAIVCSETKFAFLRGKK